MSIKLFHVSSTVLKPNKVILPHSVYQKNLGGERAELEEYLRRTAPPGVDRAQCVFLFLELSAALRYACRYSGNIYEVSLTNGLLHRGDMNKLDNILDVFRFTDDEDLRVAVTNEYWKDGTHVFAPCYEILASECTVVRLVASYDEIKELDKNLPIEQTEQYKALFIKTYCQ